MEGILIRFIENPHRFQENCIKERTAILDKETSKLKEASESSSFSWHEAQSHSASTGQS